MKSSNHSDKIIYERFGANDDVGGDVSVFTFDLTVDKQINEYIEDSDDVPKEIIDVKYMEDGSIQFLTFWFYSQKESWLPAEYAKKLCPDLVTEFFARKLTSILNIGDVYH
ncbi:hypothetical protein TRFO_43219 [Tritrichomonas foetus]|uniref:Chromo domain-containing protein n=1 Tax=Tritrichomonas foetus TaxID=1144522 RepID=A0A1J4JJA9_9EUKA|nr:hypothetical protein TRFO_08490 [Tritrichomonas foetus]OHS99244.1 hypothetical protein TRFO_08492 [Tritrichomonas foetus]OHS99246.1 hypothetical protein TRFO_08494 [Tritrichomonas foetus]OHT13893.1 hypothetical protein TRFO_43219 [Tritrichomonas foetus]|eukprot:OHS99242.1 hypothetical protein TRFO_08490 [Tritrichomonas foetus]